MVSAGFLVGFTMVFVVVGMCFSKFLRHFPKMIEGKLKLR